MLNCGLPGVRIVSRQHQARSKMTRTSSSPAEQRGKMIKLLEDALMLADDLEDGNTGGRSDSRQRIELRSGAPLCAAASLGQRGERSENSRQRPRKSILTASLPDDMVRAAAVSPSRPPIRNGVMLPGVPGAPGMPGSPVTVPFRDRYPTSKPAAKSS
jgi:hypothetical protein